ncbi:MAG TPA: hypothetical protein VFV36_03120, partial [Candidatus Methylomirabilis sp.]|nr:hypothetical protein [Candidatus Methylomirabilis sp.]
MKRIVSTVLVVGLLALPGVPALAPVASAEHVTEQALMEQLTKIKAMVGDLEMKMTTKKMLMMDPKGTDKTMDMLM